MCIFAIDYDYRCDVWMGWIAGVIFKWCNIMVSIKQILLAIGVILRRCFLNSVCSTAESGDWFRKVERLVTDLTRDFEWCDISSGIGIKWVHFTKWILESSRASEILKIRKNSDKFLAVAAVMTVFSKKHKSSTTLSSRKTEKLVPDQTNSELNNAKSRTNHTVKYD